MLTLRSTLSVATLAASLLLTVPVLAASSAFPRLEQPALAVRSPQQAVLLAAVLAGPRIVAVGERGVVLLSDDGGTVWRQARSVPISVTLTAVRFVDAQHGWAVGHGGVVLRSQDGGETWSRMADGRTLAQAALQAAQLRVGATPNDPAAARQLKAAKLLVDDGPDKPLLDLDFSDACHGFVVGAYNLFFETTDCGRSWTSAMERLQNPKALHLYAIQVHGPAVFIVGEQGLIQRSADGGRSFAAVPSPYAGSWFSLAALSDGAWLIAGLRGNAYRSADEGQSWQRLAGAAPISFVSVVALPGGAALLANQAGELLSTQAGAPLVRLRLPALPPLTDVLPLADGALLAVGMTGAIRLEAPAAVSVGAVGAVGNKP